MTDGSKTLTYIGTGLMLAVLGWVTAPRATMPDVFADRGQKFFPGFSDPTLAQSLEVVEFDGQTATARPFKVQVTNGLWTIPSLFNYPADGKDRLAKTAAAIIALRKEGVATDNVSEHERTATLDPLDETLPSLKGRGTRIVIRGENERVLADVIIGKPLEGRPTLRFVRVPTQRRVYVAEVGDLNISTRFGDWIERDLLQVDWDEVDQVVIRNYSLDEATRGVNLRDTTLIEKRGADGWAVRNGAPGEAVDTFRMNLLVTALDQLSIVGVYPKPTGVSTGLRSTTGEGRKVSRDDIRELASKGFYFTSSGQLLSNEGEVLVHTKRGIFYTLRFGEVAPVEGDAPAEASVAAGAQKAGSTSPVTAGAAANANRYLLVTVSVDRSAAPEGQALEAVKKRATFLQSRFAPWYVVSTKSFDQIRLQRSDLVKMRAANPN